MASRLLMALTMKLGAPDHRGGGEYEFECPEIGCKSDGKKKFGINLKSGKFNCWRCHSGGLLVDLLERLGIDRDMVVVRRAEVEKPKGPLPSVIPGFRPFVRHEGDGSIMDNAIVDMCQERGQLGYRDICALGWGRSDETWLSGRLIVPIVMDGDLVQYLARAAFRYIEPKEKGGPESQGWWPKERCVYGLDVPGMHPGADLVVVEGIWDWAAVRRMGLPWAGVASLGTSLGEYAIGCLLRSKPRSVTVLYDGDTAGRKATIRVARKLAARRAPLLRVAYLPEGRDPDDLTPDRLKEVVGKATPFIG